LSEAARARSKEKARPYPWGTLDVLTRQDAAAARALDRWSRAFVRTQEVASILAGLLDASVALRVHRVHEGAQDERAGDDGVGVILAASDTPGPSNAALVEVEPALGVALVARALRRTRPRILANGGAPELLAGSVAAIAVAAARRVHMGRAIGVLSAGSARALERDLRSRSGALVEASLTVLLNDEAFAARVLVPRAAVEPAPEPAWTRGTLAALGDVPLSLSIVAGVNHSTAGEVGTLRRGDAWLLGAGGLRRTRSGSIEGEVLLTSPAHEVGLRAVLGEDGRLVLREGVEPLAWARRALDPKEERLNESDNDALVDAVGEVPVVVRVEVGVAEMRAREWASLVAGDVVSLGRKIGEAVTLRIGSVTVARGELVEIDGELAVRILGRTEGDATSGTGRALKER
jgi:flagellar motor switch/type III secretory pathway protein FliN